MFSPQALGQAPRTATEEKLAAIWAQMLSRERVGVHDNFFDLGGHSLLAAQLVYRIRHQFASDLPLRTFFEIPTIAALAAHIDSVCASDTAQPSIFNQRPATKYQHLLPLQTQGSLPPLYFLPGGGGGESEFLEVYAGLIHRLGPDRPVYGFIISGAGNGAAPPDTVPALAAAYLAELRTVQPQGPYYLAGECIGGKLALEMGRLLRQNGEEAAVVMLNTVVSGLARETAQGDGFGSSEGRSGGSSRNLRGVRRRLRELRRLPLKQRLPRLGSMIRNTASVLAPVTEGQQQRRTQRAVRMDYMRLLRLFVPAPYDGEVVILMTSDLRARSRDHGWWPYLGGVVYSGTLDGAHRTYLGEHVEANAAYLRQWLDRVQDEAGHHDGKHHPALPLFPELKEVQ